ncbi:hypothetical protein LCGC14_2513220 [marine sediment metagenome]|uniref:Uncharacterized protein n=1 Tax=marine sediment metagenome TaxID=412755 RepID=A0A0F9DRX1_9ZZZZ
MVMTPITIEDLPKGQLEKPYYSVGDRGFCDVCNWSSAFKTNKQIWLCDEHARELGKLW